MPKGSACLLILLLTACTRSTQGTSDPALQPRSPSVLPGNTAGVGAASWTLIPSSEVKRYVSTGTAALELQSDTGVNRVSLVTTTAFSLATFWETSLTRIHGTLDSHSTRTDSQITPAEQSNDHPLSFSGRLINGGFVLDSLDGHAPGAGDCRNQGLNSLTALRRNLIATPILLTSGMTWTDSSTVSGCSGSIPLQVTMVRTYSVIGETSREGNPVIVLDRADRIDASGEGAQGQHRVTITSQGSGSARLYLDRESGLLQSSEGKLQTQITVNASGRTQVFGQIVDERTVRQN